MLSHWGVKPCFSTVFRSVSGGSAQDENIVTLSLTNDNIDLEKRHCPFFPLFPIDTKRNVWQ